MTNLRKQISQILVKWGTGTKQAMISDLMKLLQPIEHCDVRNCVECQTALLKAQVKKMKAGIKRIKVATQKQTGSFKYDVCYDECLQVIEKYK
jgi:hypothetical protein